MSILYPQYLAIKNKYCFAYFGVFDEFIRQLIYIRPFLEKQYPGLELYISCKDNLMERYKDVPRMVARSQLYKSEYAYVREIIYNQIDHPIQTILNENDLKIPKNTWVPGIEKKCIITTENLKPFPSLDLTKINKLKSYAMRQGYYCEINDDLTDVDWVLGIENDTFYKAATQGIKTTLVTDDKESSKTFTNLFPTGDFLLFNHI